MPIRLEPFYIYIEYDVCIFPTYLYHSNLYYHLFVYQKHGNQRVTNKTAVYLPSLQISIFTEAGPPPTRKPYKENLEDFKAMQVPREQEKMGRNGTLLGTNISHPKNSWKDVVSFPIGGIC